ncbi:ankyrin [Apiospora kogelbergensis]|uniref:ankyrin n=1 Tax=Apiospora kogelbergensis TaxID=1337665 RepID=UPI00312FE5C4
MSSKRSQRNREWYSFRPDIERMFIKEGRRLEDIVAWLEEHGFHTTKSTLANKLNKAWKLRKRAPRGQAFEHWKATGKLFTSLQQNGDPTTGSLVCGNGQRMRIQNLERQIRRNVIETHLSNFGLTGGLQSHTGLSLTFRPPTPKQVEFHIRWPSNLPWLVSAVQKLQIRTDTYSQASGPVLHIFPPEAFNLTSDELSNARSRKQAVQNLASQIPEEEGDALRRAQVVLSDRTAEALAEALKLLVFKLSNGFIKLLGKLELKDLKIFNFLVYLLDHLGITKTPIKLPHEDFTMRAFRDTLYKGIFLSLWTASLDRFTQVQFDYNKFVELQSVKGYPVWMTPMMFILDTLSEDHGFSIVQYLFEHVDSSYGFPYRDVVNWSSLLLYASFSGRTSILEFLLSRYHIIPHQGHSTIHEFVNIRTERGITPLCAAAAKLNSTQTCQILLRNGATDKPEEDYFSSALCMARWRRCQDTIELLLHHNKAQGWNYVSPVASKHDDWPNPIEQFIWSMISEYQLHIDTSPPWYQMDLRSIVVKGQKHAGGRWRAFFFEAGAPLRPGDAAIAVFHGDWDLATGILKSDPTNVSQYLQASIDDWKTPNWETPDWETSVTLLEAALLSGSRSVAEKVFRLDPSQFSAGALCAATLEASTSKDDSLVRSLLNNRDKHSPLERNEACMAMTAIGIAAYKGSWKLLQLLKAHLPWSKQAIIPDHSTGQMVQETLENLPHTLSEFWHSDIEGDAQIFAFKSEMKIFNLFVNDHILMPSTLSLLIEEGMEHRIQSLVRLGYRVQAVPHEYIQPYGWSPLHQAIDKDNASLVQACLDLGLDINGCYQGTVGDPWGFDTAYTPLTYSILENRLEIANLLITNGACIHRIGNGWHGVTPLQAASRKIDLGMAMKLLQSGADPNYPGSYFYQERALEWAAFYGRLDMVALLLLSGTDTQSTGRLSYIQAARRAIRRGHKQVYELLRSHRPWDAADEELYDRKDLLYYRKLPDGVSNTTSYDEWKASLKSREGTSELIAGSEEVGRPASERFMDEDAPRSSALAEDAENAMGHPEGVWTGLDDQDLHEKAVVSQMGLVTDAYWGSSVIEGSTSTPTWEELEDRI